MAHPQILVRRRKIVAWYLGATPHEFGHAFAAWLVGHFAIPLPAVLFTITSGQPSILPTLCFLALGVYGGIAWRRTRQRAGVLLVVLFFVHIFVRSLLPEQQAQVWILLGGCLGEIVLSALGVAAFSLRFPDRLRWDFWRFGVLVWSSMTLMHSVALWYSVGSDLRKMPMGSASGDARDGDMNRLISGFDWTVSELAGLYTKVTYLTCALLVMYLRARVGRARRNRERRTV
jgi:hypothetical protein